MAKVSFLRRLITEDFKKDQQDLIGKIAFILNPAFESIVSAFNKNLNINDNFNGASKSITVKVDAAGTPIIPTTFKSGVVGLTKVVLVGRASNQANTAVYPTGYPLISWTEDSQGLLTIQNITGLQANTSYLLEVITLG